MIKKVGSAIYSHWTNFNELLKYVKTEHLQEVKELYDRLVKYNIMESDFKNQDWCFYHFTIIKYDNKKETISFIKSDNFDTVNEPEVGHSILYYLTQDEENENYDCCAVFPKRKNNPQIYHHKELFVADDYTGFDLEAAKKRSELYEPILTKEDKRRIGNKDYWVKWCAEHGILL